MLRRGGRQCWKVFATGSVQNSKSFVKGWNNNLKRLYPSSSVFYHVHSYFHTVTEETEEWQETLSPQRLDLLQGLFLNSGATGFEDSISCHHLEKTLVQLVGAQNDTVTKNVIHRVLFLLLLL